MTAKRESYMEAKTLVIGTSAKIDDQTENNETNNHGDYLTALGS
jgi:hypothetical protein